jgi:hypothetical protein
MEGADRYERFKGFRNSFQAPLKDHDSPQCAHLLENSISMRVPNYHTHR